MMGKIFDDELKYQVIGCAMNVHNTLGSVRKKTHVF